MKKKNIFYWYIIIIFFLISCNSDFKPDQFSVEVDVVMKKSDSVHVYYTTDGTIDFNENQSFWQKVKGSSRNQTVFINFPKDTIPSQLRFDFGRNRSQPDIVLNKVRFIYKDKAVEMEGKEIYKYLRVDDSYTVLDKELGLLKRKQPGQSLGPSLYPNGENLKNELLKLTSVNKE